MCEAAPASVTDGVPVSEWDGVPVLVSDTACDTVPVPLGIDVRVSE